MLSFRFYFNYSLFLIYLLCFGNLINCDQSDGKLEQMKEQEVLDLLNDGNNIIALFCKTTNCVDDTDTDITSTLESLLLSVREELVEATNAWVIKSNSPTLGKEYGLKESAIVYIRNGSPLLYSGALDEDVILKFFVENKESALHQLNDDTFEHQTQVSTGATTGDWLIVFVKEGCKQCGQHLPIVEMVAAQSKGRKNVAIIHRDKDGGATARRFGIKSFPSYVFFRLGSMYVYDLPLLDADTLSTFIEDGFRNAKKLQIPQPKSPFDDLVEWCVDWLKENPSQFLFGTLASLLVIGFIVALNMAPPKSWTAKKKKKH